jgi:hypothetical protein
LGEGHPEAAEWDDPTTTSDAHHLAGVESSDRSTMSVVPAERRRGVQPQEQTPQEQTLQEPRRQERSDERQGGLRRPTDEQRPEQPVPPAPLVQPEPPRPDARRERADCW